MERLCCNELNRDGEGGFLIHEQNYSELAVPVPARTAVANKQASDETYVVWRAVTQRRHCQ